MPSFIPLTRLAPEALHHPKSSETLDRHVAEQVRAHCPEARGVVSNALLGPRDDLDVVEAPDVGAATRVSVLVRNHGHAHTEVWPALEWPDFRRLLRELPARPA
jgi:uncharacterized protein with GYD domain